MFTNKIKILGIFIGTMLWYSCVQEKGATTTNDLDQPITTYLQRAMEFYNIPGLAVAVVQGDGVSYRHFFGKASLAEGDLVDKNTLFRVFSTTKLITATAIFQLVQEGKLHLEDGIADHLEGMPAHWEDVTIKNLLSHSSGLPDMIRLDQSLSDAELLSKLSDAPMDFTTGSRFGYNQTNYWLLAQIIEKITHIPFEKFIADQQFPKVSDGFLFSSNSQERIPNRAMRYFFNPKTKMFEEDTNNNGKRAHSGNGLNISLDAFIAWNKRMDSGILLKKETKNKMWAPFRFSNGKDEFLHGWGLYKVNGLVSYGFTGGNLSAFRKFPSQDLTIVLLSNGYRIPAYDIIVNDIARMVVKSKVNHKPPKLEHSVMELMVGGELEKALTMYNALKKENPNTNFDNLRYNVNTFGNNLVRDNAMEKAFQVFKWNADANPDWWIAIAALAEAYQAKVDYKQAIVLYKEAIALNIGNEYGYNEIMHKEINQIKTEILK